MFFNHLNRLMISTFLILNNLKAAPQKSTFDYEKESIERYSRLKIKISMSMLLQRDRRYIENDRNKCSFKQR